jgi:hypothetical protein
MLPSLNRVYHEPNQMNHVTVVIKCRNAASLQIRFWVCTPSNEALRNGSLQPYRSVFGCAPPPTKLSGHNALRQTKSLRISDPCSRTLPLSLSLCSRVLLLLGVYDLLPVFPCSVSGVSNPGRHSSVDNTLTIKRFDFALW